jgi:hypothetical protein
MRRIAMAAAAVALLAEPTARAQQEFVDKWCTSTPPEIERAQAQAERAHQDLLQSIQKEQEFETSVALAKRHFGARCQRLPECAALDEAVARVRGSLATLQESVAELDRAEAQFDAQREAGCAEMRGHLQQLARERRELHESEVRNAQLAALEKQVSAAVRESPEGPTTTLARVLTAGAEAFARHPLGPLGGATPATSGIMVRTCNAGSCTYFATLNNGQTCHSTVVGSVITTRCN